MYGWLICGCLVGQDLASVFYVPFFGMSKAGTLVTTFWLVSFQSSSSASARINIIVFFIHFLSKRPQVHVRCKMGGVPFSA